MVWRGKSSGIQEGLLKHPNEKLSPIGCDLKLMYQTPLQIALSLLLLQGYGEGRNAPRHEAHPLARCPLSSPAPCACVRREGFNFSFGDRTYGFPTSCKLRSSERSTTSLS